MDKHQFINSINEVVSKAAKQNTIDNLSDPPGRRPGKELVEQSEWYNSLERNDRDMVNRTISEAVDEAIFGFLCVVDGVRSISNSGEENNLALSHGNVLLNDLSGEYLHDIYKNV